MTSLLLASAWTTLADLAPSSEGEPRELGALLDFAPGAAIWTWVAFLLALPVMWKFVYGPITRALEERDSKVDDAIKAAEEARQAAEAQVAAAKQELDQARADARRTVEEATARAERQAAESLRAAKDEAKAQLEKARQDIAAEKQSALLELRKHVVDLTVAATGQILKQDVDDDAHRRMVDDFVSGVEGGGVAGGGVEGSKS